MPRKKGSSRKSSHKSNKAKHKNGANGTVSQSEVDKLKESGNNAFIKKKYDKAIILYTKAISLEIDNHTLYANRSAAYAKLNNIDEAYADAISCIQLQPKWSKGYLRKFNVLMQDDKIADAVEVYKDALDKCDNTLSIKV